jgi:hypothetical protein
LSGYSNIRYPAIWGQYTSEPEEATRSLTETPCINYPLVEENRGVGKEDPSPAHTQKSTTGANKFIASSNSRDIEHGMYRALSRARLFDLALNIVFCHVDVGGVREARSGCHENSSAAFRRVDYSTPRRATIPGLVIPSLAQLAKRTTA